MTRHPTEPGNGSRAVTEDTNPGVCPPTSGVAPSAHATEVAQEILRLTPPNGGDGHDIGRTLKRNTWLVSFIVALFGSGGFAATYFVTVDRAKANAAELKTQDTRIDANAKGIVEIKVHVDKLDESIGEQKVIQQEIKSGIGELKQENVKRLKENAEQLQDELNDARRELRRRRRNDNR